MTITALTEFKRQIDQEGGEDLLRSWRVNNSTSYCEWEGVSCDIGAPDHVIDISLPGLGLQGTIAPVLSSLTFLINLNLSYNAISGDIPQFPPSLKFLDLSYNHLSGSIHTSTLSNLANLQTLDISYNALTGLNLFHNLLSGAIPSQLANCSMLHFLNLAQNNLSGSIPATLGTLSDLQVLVLWSNTLTGSIPAELGNCSYLVYLELSLNALTGAIPHQLGAIPFVCPSDPLIDGLLNLRSNSLSGNVPSALGNCSGLRMLYLNFNRLEGSIPQELGKLRNLRQLYFTGNYLTGQVPPSLGELVILEELMLNYNMLEGTIPESFSNLTAITILDLATTGNLPETFANASAIITFHMADNDITGTIPSLFGRLPNLQRLDLQGNQLHGLIPAELGNACVLSELNLQRNRLEGALPLEIGQIPSNLSNLNVTAASFADNSGLCGPPLAHLCHDLAKSYSKGNSRLIIAIILCGISAFLTLICCVFAWRKKYGPLAEAKQKFHQDSSKTLSAIRITAKELNTATGGFNEANLIGTGGTSKVYKATLREGLLVAVKKFNWEGNLQKAECFFRKECETLGKMRHRNLVRILSTCCNLEMKAIVLEYMPNGSLEKFLFENEEYQLNWRMLVDISSDVAQALVYLHHEGDVPVIHCDLKPSNILLDKTFTANLSDFGIARLLSPADDSYSASYFRGSIGYIAPECGELAHYSVKGDIHSYGVVLLCMLTGRQPTSEEFYEQGVEMPNWVKRLWPDRYLDALHPNLRLEVEASARQAIEKEVLQVMALWCTAQAPKHRPTSKDVVRKLTLLKSPHRHFKHPTLQV
ncbi:hypothetical protein GOP47_0020545 [Adiantum capillus-veneris]|uniref:non-specific serine/threonine protein kinase n=1 Tax=Adiantum capillus-veneris TaxID=13818 RepID=A0A9D4U9K8_ADICA|nr:hypothetical protein GOP47_0020545 [Adiantum capillus-veneris]